MIDGNGTHQRRVLRRRPARGDADAGAVAIIVALLISTVLLTVGALTVDLGTLWAERVRFTSVAEAAALAAAELLPVDPRVGVTSAVEADVQAAAVRVLCAAGNRSDQWDSTVCPGSGSSLPPWVDNVTGSGAADTSDGAVIVSPSDANAYPGISVPDELPWVVRVVTPPVHVDFGLARASGIDGTSFTASAGARRGLPYPAEDPVPDSPYYLTVQDLQDNIDNNTGSVCLRTTPQLGATSPLVPPVPTPGFSFSGWQTDASGVVGDTDSPGNGNPNLPDNSPAQFSAVQAAFPATVPAASVTAAAVTVYVGTQDAAHAARTDSVTPDASGTWTITFTTPDLTGDPLYGDDVPVWWVFTDPLTGTDFVSDHRSLDYPAPPGPTSSDCDSAAPQGRGLVDAASLSTRSVRTSVVQGLGRPGDPTPGTDLHAFGSWPQGQQLPALDQACYDLVPAVVVRPDVIGEATEDANCVPLRSAVSINTQDLTDGWLKADSPAGAGGRLDVRQQVGLPTAQRCSTQTRSASGGRVMDQTDLFRRSNGLVTPSVDRFGLRSRIRAGLAADGTYREQLTPKIFNCRRLLLVPVLDTSVPPNPAGHYAVVGLTYFWVSDVKDWNSLPPYYRGLITDTANQVVGIRGWVVDPLYVQGGDWIVRDEDPDTRLPMAVPKAAVLARTPCDDHPDSSTTGCPP